MKAFPNAPGAGESWVEPTTGLAFRWVPAGRFWTGSSADASHPCSDPQGMDNERPALEIELTYGTWMCQHPLRYTDYEPFVRQKKHRKPAPWRKKHARNWDAVLTDVDWYDARAWCRWFNDTGQLPNGFVADLPTEAEWERAARGVDGRIYPWGTEAPEAMRHVTEAGPGTRALVGAEWVSNILTGACPTGVSPVGCHDMVGGVWEWTLDHERSYEERPPTDPCALTEGSSNIQDIGDRAVRASMKKSVGARMVRGGSVGLPLRFARCAARLPQDPKGCYRDCGVRVVLRPATINTSSRSR